MKLETRTEPEYDAEDRALIAALLDYDADLCPGCGLPLSQTLAMRPVARSEDRVLARYWRDNPDVSYVTRFLVCRACVNLGTARRLQEERDNKGKWVIPESRHWQVLPRPTD